MSEERYIASRKDRSSVIEDKTDSINQRGQYDRRIATTEEKSNEADVKILGNDDILSLNLGIYSRQFVSNLPPAGPHSPSSLFDDIRDGRNLGHSRKMLARKYFDAGLLHAYSYNHQLAAVCFLKCLDFEPNAFMAHWGVSYAHSPNYNFQGVPYYGTWPEPASLSSTCKYLETFTLETDALGIFPSPKIADKHIKLALRKAEQLKKHHACTNEDKFDKNMGFCGLDILAPPTDLELGILRATALRTSIELPEVNKIQDPKEGSKSRNINSTDQALELGKKCSSGSYVFDMKKKEADRRGRYYADALADLYLKYPEDDEVSFLYIDSLMVLHAWHLFEHPSRLPLPNAAKDILEIRRVFEISLKRVPTHPGFCHLGIHFYEMGPNPSESLPLCFVLRERYPDAGHLIHMATHIYLLLGDYSSCVKYSIHAIQGDTKIWRSFPQASGFGSSHIAYWAHNFHLLIYGAMMGGMESVATEFASRLNLVLTEENFEKYPMCELYLEGYSVTDVHVLIRFGRWEKILQLQFPRNPVLMLTRAAFLRYAHALAYAALGEVRKAEIEVCEFERLRCHPQANCRILHNNSLKQILDLNTPMLLGEIAYRKGNFDDAFNQLRRAVILEDGLNFDEPRGKMQPARHALGGLLLEQNQLEEAESVFCTDLKTHPCNPWSLVGLIKCKILLLEDVKKKNVTNASVKDAEEEILVLKTTFAKQRASPFSDYRIEHSCGCCGKGIK